MLPEKGVRPHRLDTLVRHRCCCSWLFCGHCHRQQAKVNGEGQACPSHTDLRGILAEKFVVQNGRCQDRAIFSGARLFGAY